MGLARAEDVVLDVMVGQILQEVASLGGVLVPFVTRDDDAAPRRLIGAKGAQEFEVDQPPGLDRKALGDQPPGRGRRAEYRRRVYSSGKDAASIMEAGKSDGSFGHARSMPLGAALVVMRGGIRCNLRAVPGIE